MARNVPFEEWFYFLEQYQNEMVALVAILLPRSLIVTFFTCSQVLLHAKSPYNYNGGVMVSVLASSMVDHGFEPRSGQIMDYKIGICCFSAKQAALRRKSKDWLARNQNNVSEWSDMSTSGPLFQ